MVTIFLINTVLGLWGFCVCCLITSVVYAPVFTVVLAQDLKGSAESAEGISLEFHRVLYLPGPEVSRVKYLNSIADPFRTACRPSRICDCPIYLHSDGWALH